MVSIPSSIALLVNLSKPFVGSSQSELVNGAIVDLGVGFFFFNWYPHVVFGLSFNDDGAGSTGGG